MKCVVFLVATATICQIVVGTPHRGKWHGFDHGYHSHSNSGEGGHPFKHPSWGQYTQKPGEPKPQRPGHYGPFGSGESSGEVTSSFATNPSPGSGYGTNEWGNGGYGGFMANGPSSTTENPTPKPNPLSSSEKDLTNEDVLIACIASCPVTEEYNPVCGSNNFTYPNPGWLECEQKCGIAVELSRLTACSVTETITTERNKCGEELVACIRKCPVTDEYNPVCGSNNVTYANPGRLACEHHCGIPVQLVKLTACVDDLTTTQKIPSQEELIAACIRTCPVTGGFNPVCGSNNETYANPGRFECARNCGVEVQLSRKTSCDAPPTEEEIKNAILLSSTNSTIAQPFINENGENNVDGENSGHKIINNNNEHNNNSEHHLNVGNGNDGSLSGANNSNQGINVNGNNKKYGEDGTDANEHSTGIIFNGENNSEQNNKSEHHLNVDNGNDGSLSGAHNSNKGINLKGDNNENGEYGTDAIEESTGITFNGENIQNPENQEKGIYHSGAGSDYGENKFKKGHGGSHGKHPGNNCHGINYSNNKRPPSVKELLECMQLCALTSESDPVCGTDDITYMNPGRLLCAQFCGIDVKVKKFASCQSTSTCNCQHCPTPCTNPPVTNAPEVTPPPITLKGCIKACPTTNIFKPVCGTNNITYKNLEKLQCAKRCGVDVSLLKETHCAAPVPNPTNGNPPVWTSTEKPTLQECIQRCSVQQKYEPICGTDNVTYNNSAHLICARQCGLDVQIKAQSPCSSISPTTEKGPVTPAQNVTIPTDLLATIWGITTSTPKDDDEDFELDQRGQDQK